MLAPRLPPMILTGSALLERFQALDALLLAHQHLWRPKPFTSLRLDWEQEHAELAHWLRGRSLEQAEAAHNQPHLMAGAPAPFPQLAASTQTLSQLHELPGNPSEALPARYSVDVPGRKWQQIEAFSSRLQFHRQPSHWLDWCAGKGHLGRLLAHRGAELTCLEFNPELVGSGQQMSDHLHIRARHLQQDVMAGDTATHLRADHTPVALHACGDLHVRLLQLASANGCQQLAVAPCCYNRIATAHYQVLSRAAQGSRLHLSLDDLRLPLSETVTAGQRQRLQRDQSMARRLAFDLLQRELRGSDNYLPTPSLPVSWLHKDFASYCRDLAELKGLRVDTAVDWSTLERRGWQRLAEVRNLELLRDLFRRPLEIWLALDRALYLQEQGYAVQLGTFCPHSLTPRNLMLLAER
ncbi:methyltransferase [Pseudomonas sp. PDM14]|uniref:methyltransferase n=1 Tax=Pseudomonas sp. PDM14 TaxID=2769288 RepID=UPI001783ADF9|nr:methyltransferase [Pseudomonas sp. PDM14]MBD9483598.1 methyltransferase [Pseudomonas sp. PDM14]